MNKNQKALMDLFNAYVERTEDVIGERPELTHYQQFLYDFVACDESAKEYLRLVIAYHCMREKLPIAKWGEFINLNDFLQSFWMGYELHWSLDDSEHYARDDKAS